MSRFPKLTETFILYEIVELEKLGFMIEVFPLLREKVKVMHPEARRIVRAAHYHPFISYSILRANLILFVASPLRYPSTLLAALVGTASSPNFFFGALGTFPKSVRFAYEMKRGAVDHIHAHFANHPALSAFIINGLTGIPYSFTAHGSDLHKDQTMLCRKIFEAKFAVTISQFNHQFILDHCPDLPEEKIQIIHCGVDTEQFQPREHHPNACPRIICVASFETVKGHHYLIEACERLVLDEIAFRCVLIGSGPQEKKIKSLVSMKGLDEHILFLGPQPRPKVIEYLSQSDIFALPSVPTSEGKREGIPVVLMEAMATGLPVVSTQLSGIPELVHPSTGILVSPRQSNQLAAAFRRLIENPSLRQELGQAGRMRIQELFDIRHNTRKLAEFF